MVTPRRNPTFRSTRHTYDIEMFDTLRELTYQLSHSGLEKTVQGHSISDYIKMQRGAIEQYCIAHKIDYDLAYSKAVPLVVEYPKSEYRLWLAVRLLISAPPQVKLYLDYHHSNNKDKSKNVEFDFRQFIEFHVLPSAISQNPFPDNKSLFQITDWIRENTDRYISDEQEMNKSSVEQSFKEDIINETMAKEMNEFDVKFTQDFADTVYTEFKVYFEEGYHAHLFEILKGYKLRRKVIFNGNTNALVEFFKRCRYQSKLNCTSHQQLAKWIQSSFKVKKKGKTSEMSLSTINDVLRDQDCEPSLELVILKNTIPYKFPSERKYTPK